MKKIEELEKELISIVVPCYNEESTLAILYEELNKVTAKMTEYMFEYLFVNDGSKDDTLFLLKEFAKKDKRVKYLSFSRNFGKEAALLAGLQYAKGDYVATMDADMQDPPSLLPELMEYVASGEYDNAATRRVDRKGEPPIRSFFARMFYKMMRHMTDIQIVDGARDYRVMNRAMVNAIISLNEYNRFSKGIFAWVGFETKWVEFENVERSAGETKWNFWKLFRYSVDGIVSFSNTPIHMASYMGLFLTAVSAIALLFIMARALLFGDPVAGWPSLACIITFLGGVQLFVTGVMGQYLSKTYMEVKKRPHYIVKDTNCEKMK
ncbi:MAG: glycosyltransferase family 2 protein [Lachnospiraceae bacterium]|nr:glycosyltransferase family 2 protein [Lachnospiraceae bacterium]